MDHFGTKGGVEVAVDITYGAFLGYVASLSTIVSMLALGLNLVPTQLDQSFRRYRLILRGIVISFILIPAAAKLITLAVPMAQPVTVGFLLASIAPGAPFGPALTRLHGSDVSFAVALMVTLAALSVVLIPAVTLVLLPEPARLNFALLPIIRALFLVQLLPLLLGVTLRARRPQIARRINRPLVWSSGMLSILLVALVLGASPLVLATLAGTGGLAAILLGIGVALVLAYFFGGPEPLYRRAMATSLVFPNMGVAVLIGTASYSERAVPAMVVGYGLVAAIVMAFLARWWGRHPAVPLTRPAGSMRA
jgi:BASS family bile acid:Na+ symporter